MLPLMGGVFLGWALGANDAANVFGTAVTSRMVRFSTAALLGSVFVILGAVLEGEAGIRTYEGLTAMTLESAVIASVAAAASVSIMTLLKLPVSTSQAMVGAILGIGLLNHQVNAGGLWKVVACWVGTPIGGALVGSTLYLVLGRIQNRLRMNLFQRDRWLRIGLVLGGCYGAYALGANNVANVTGVFVSAGMLTVPAAAVLGGVSIALGICTFSRRVMHTVGKGLVRLDAFSALIVILAEAATVHFYTVVGVPVSTSQAVIGAVLGVGLVKGLGTIRPRALVGIAGGWLLAPVVAGALTLLIASLT